MLRHLTLLMLSALLVSPPAAALPEGSVEVGVGAGVGSGVGAVVGATASYLMLNSGFSVSNALGNNDAVGGLFLDVLLAPAVGVIGGAAVGAFAVSAFQGTPISPAPVTAAAGAGLTGTVCAAPFCLAGVSAIDQANNTSDCGDACALAVGGLLFFGMGYLTFCATGPVGAGVGGGLGAAFVAPEIPPEEVTLPAAPEAPPAPPPPAPVPEPAPASEAPPAMTAPPEPLAPPPLLEPTPTPSDDKDGDEPPGDAPASLDLLKPLPTSTPRAEADKKNAGEVAGVSCA